MHENKSVAKPPRFGKWLLRSFCSYDFLSTALWDLEELYELNLEERGKVRADLLYIKNALGVILHLYFKGDSHYSLNHFSMVRNNINVSLRNLKKRKAYTVLNLAGLSTGLAVFLLITLYVSYEFSYDNYHEHKDRVFSIYKSDIYGEYQGSNKYANTPGPLANALKVEFPEVTHAARMIRYNNTLIRAAGEVYMEPVVYAADPDVFQILSFEPVSAGITAFLQEPNSVAISESLALKYFGKSDVAGEMIDFRNQHAMTVSGVFKDMPDNSHFTADLFVNFETLMTLQNERLDRWNSNSYYTYIRVSENADADLLQEKLPQLRAKYADDPIDEDGQTTNYYLQPLQEVHFGQGINFGIAPVADAQRLYIYMGIAFMVLLIASVNYVNLATARAANRAKEIGIRKVIGAGNRSLAGQFLIESGLLVFLSMFFAIGLVSLSLPAFASFVDRKLIFDFSNPMFWFLVSGLGFGLTLLSGFYPALLLTSFNPLKSLYGRGDRQRSGFFRNALVVFQFTISSGLIIGAIVLSGQLHYIDNVDAGYTREQVVIINVRDRGVRNQLTTFKDELRKVPGVVAVASSRSLPNNITSTTNASWPGKTEEEITPIFTTTVSLGFFELYDVKVLAGRVFDPEIPNDNRGVILNETAVKTLGWDEPLGRQLFTEQGDTNRVIGVIKDFHLQSLRQEIEPLQITMSERHRRVSVKTEGDRASETLAALQKKYESFSPEYPFNYSYLDDIFDRAYQNDLKTAQLAQWFTALAILIACLGLYGLATHKVQQRVKEVGVRKVLGASVLHIIRLLSEDFLKLLLIAFAISAPVSYYIMNNWLTEFAYHVSIGALTFVAALLMMIVISGLSVGYRTYRAAISNPVDALRDE